MRRIIERLNKASFFKNVLVLMSGTAIAQLIALALTPILTRNYSPNDFAYFTTFMAFYGVASVFATGKYERAILLLEKEEEVRSISTLCVLISIFTTLFSYILLFGFTFVYDYFFIEKDFFKWLFLLPVLLVVNSINTVFLTYLNYKRRFSEMSKNRVIKTFSTLIVSISCIFWLKNMGGLILAEILGWFIATLFLWKKLFFLIDLKNINWGKTKELGKRFLNFPKYNIPSDFLHNATEQVPTFFLMSAFGSNVTGQYGLMRRVVDAPLALLSSSIMEVFRQQAAEDYYKTGSCRPIFIKTAKYLVMMSVIPFLFLLIFAPDIFVFIFGKEWYKAGTYASIFSVFYFFKFVSSPLSYVFYIAEKQKVNFFLYLYICCSTVLIFSLPIILEVSIEQVLWLCTLNFVLRYIVYFILSYKYSIKG
ncbi:lipopolysaccharide biosynthesis protein [Capnocytophaga sp. H4358]|uniref:lipopolysaccharide biosynthesis protein n=1 Tax=Capnocytophaga sp. H4358 TaxID=1945658 RepID=UPI0012FF7827|nr:oligosaccharide flippase family protein [Capnocytophaga sp. H4358]